ncbi:MAG: ligand-binding sensor domain-containing protein [Candidatus Latescibacterota bacterium]
MKRLCIALFVMFTVTAASDSAQETVASYPDGNNVNDLEISGNYVWCATWGGLVRWNRSDGTYRHFTNKDGMVSSSITAVQADNTGKIWLGGGITQCFDGTAFTTYTLENSPITSPAQALAAQDDGTVWFGASKGLYRLKNGEWKAWTSADGLPEGNVKRLAVDKAGVAWGATSALVNSKSVYYGLFRFDGTTFTTYTTANSGLKSNEIGAIAIGADNTTWIVAGGFTGKLYKFDGTTWAEQEPAYVNDVTVDSKGTVWAACGNPGGNMPDARLYSLEGASWVSHPVGSLFEYPPVILSSVRVDSDGIIWLVAEFSNLGSHPKHLCRYDGKSLTFCRTEGLYSNTVNGIAIDANNVKWFATGYGISRFDGKSWTTYNFKLTREDVSATANLESLNLIENMITSVAVDKNNIVWATTGNRVVSFDGQKWISNSVQSDLKSYAGMASEIAVDKDNVKWFARNSRIASYDGKTWSSYSQNVITKSVAVDADNVKWFGTNTGVMKFDGTTWTSYHEYNSPLTAPNVAVAVDRNNTKWFTSPSGIVSFDGTTWKTYDKTVTGLTISASSMLYMEVDTNNVLWISNGSLTSFDGTIWKHYSQSVTGMTTYFTIDKDGVLWLKSQGMAGETLSALKAASLPASVAETAAIPIAVELQSNYPNPFNPSTTLEFTLPKAGTVELAVYSITGQKVRTLTSGALPAGMHKAVWDGRDDAGETVSSGVYLSRLRVGNTTRTSRMLLLK